VNPIIMKQQETPTGIKNDDIIKQIANKCHYIVAAWGTLGSFMNRDQQVIKLLGHRELYCLGVNQNGSPKHPLYLSREVKIQTWKEKISKTG